MMKKTQRSAISLYFSLSTYALILIPPHATLRTSRKLHFLFSAVLYVDFISIMLCALVSRIALNLLRCCYTGSDSAVQSTAARKPAFALRVCSELETQIGRIKGLTNEKKIISDAGFSVVKILKNKWLLYLTQTRRFCYRKYRKNRNSEKNIFVSDSSGTNALFAQPFVKWRTRNTLKKKSNDDVYLSDHSDINNTRNII